MCNFMRFYACFSTFTWKREIPTSLYWLVGLILPFNFLGCRTPPNLNFWGVRTPTTPTVVAPLKYAIYHVYGGAENAGHENEGHEIAGHAKVKQKTSSNV